MPFGFNPLSGSSVFDTLNEILSFGSEYTESYNMPEPTVTPEAFEAGQQTEEQLANLGIDAPQGDATNDVRTAFEMAGVDVDDPAVGSLITSIQAQLEGGDAAAANSLPLLAQSLAQRFPAVPATEYSDAFAASGFSGAYPHPEVAQSVLPGLRQRPGLSPEELDSVQPGAVTQPRFEQQPDTGWMRFKNGVLVDPTSGSVFYEPSSHAPGSPWWKMQVTRSWGEDRISEWRTELSKLGYLTEDQAKVKGVDTVFLNALTTYHTNRYLNGGKPVAGDVAGAAGAGSDVKPVNLRDFGAQIRNDVRENYMRVYGVEPSDGEVQAWSDYITRTGMQLQKRFIRKYETPMTDTAATEAEERFIERLESQPDAVFLRESAEENTRLRDTFDRMAQVTSSLVG